MPTEERMQICEPRPRQWTTTDCASSPSSTSHWKKNESEPRCGKKLHDLSKRLGCVSSFAVRLERRDGGSERVMVIRHITVQNRVIRLQAKKQYRGGHTDVCNWCVITCLLPH